MAELFNALAGLAGSFGQGYQQGTEQRRQRDLQDEVRRQRAEQFYAPESDPRTTAYRAANPHLNPKVRVLRKDVEEFERRTRIANAMEYLIRGVGQMQPITGPMTGGIQRLPAPQPPPILPAPQPPPILPAPQPPPILPAPQPPPILPAPQPPPMTVASRAPGVPTSGEDTEAYQNVRSALAVDPRVQGITLPTPQVAPPPPTPNLGLSNVYQFAPVGTAPVGTAPVGTAPAIGMVQPDRIGDLGTGLVSVPARPVLTQPGQGTIPGKSVEQVLASLPSNADPEAVMQMLPQLYAIDKERQDRLYRAAQTEKLEADTEPTDVYDPRTMKKVGNMPAYLAKPLQVQLFADAARDERQQKTLDEARVRQDTGINASFERLSQQIAAGERKANLQYGKTRGIDPNTGEEVDRTPQEWRDALREFAKSVSPLGKSEIKVNEEKVPVLKSQAAVNRARVPLLGAQKARQDQLVRDAPALKAGLLALQGAEVDALYALTANRKDTPTQTYANLVAVMAGQNVMARGKGEAVPWSNPQLQAAQLLGGVGVANTGRGVLAGRGGKRWQGEPGLGKLARQRADDTGALQLFSVPGVPGAMPAKVIKWDTIARHFRAVKPGENITPDVLALDGTPLVLIPGQDPGWVTRAKTVSDTTRTRYAEIAQSAYTLAENSPAGAGKGLAGAARSLALHKLDRRSIEGTLARLAVVPSPAMKEARAAGKDPDAEAKRLAAEAGARGDSTLGIVAHIESGLRSWLDKGK